MILMEDTMKNKMIKRLITLCITIAIFSIIPEFNSFAEEKKLKQIASSLGADTDYFNFVNYRPTECSDEMVDYLKALHPSLDSGIALQMCNASGLCNGFAVLEVLNHNGVITPSDLQEGAETLKDVECTPYVNDALCYYSIMQDWNLQEFVYREYFCSHDLKEQCQDLIKHGEKAVETGKWFLIAFYSEKIAHAIVGIGIADGNWTFNEKSYDKCILTLDCNLRETMESTKAAGFGEKNCIYINSEKQEFYFPVYDCDSANGNTFITLITDDTDMLNWLGYIKPSQSYSEKYDRIKKIQLHHRKSGEYDISVEVNGNTEKYHGYPEQFVEGLTKNQWSPTFIDTVSEYYREADKITIESMQNDKQFVGCDLRDMNAYANVFELYGKGRVTYSDNEFTFNNLDDNENRYYYYASRVNFITGEFTFPWQSIMTEGTCKDAIKIKISNDGILFTTTDSTVKNNIELGKWSDGLPVGTNRLKIFASNNVMIRCKENSDEIYFAIGENFDIPVETGDVNCDGYINAVDASYILSDYAYAATGQKTFLNVKLADYNGDDAVNAVDASFVLSEYARRSTK